MKSDERKILYRNLHEIHGQLIGFIIIGGQIRHFMNNFRRFGIVPAGTLSGAPFSQRHDEIGVPAVDLGINILRNPACGPITGDLVISGGSIGIPGRTALAGQAAVESKLDQLVIGSGKPASCLCLRICQISHLNRKGLALEIPSIRLLFQPGLEEQLLRRLRIIFPAADAKHIGQFVFVRGNIIPLVPELF